MGACGLKLNLCDGAALSEFLHTRVLSSAAPKHFVLLKGGTMQCIFVNSRISRNSRAPQTSVVLPRLLLLPYGASGLGAQDFAKALEAYRRQSCRMQLVRRLSTTGRLCIEAAYLHSGISDSNESAVRAQGGCEVKSRTILSKIVT